MLRLFYHCHRKNASLMLTKVLCRSHSHGCGRNKWVNKGGEKPGNVGIPWFLHTQELIQQSRKKPRGEQSHSIRGLCLQDLGWQNRILHVCVWIYVCVCGYVWICVYVCALQTHTFTHICCIMAGISVTGCSSGCQTDGLCPTKPSTVDIWSKLRQDLKFSFWPLVYLTKMIMPYF